MAYHRFKVGQTVYAPPGGLDALIPHGPFVIMRLLPLVDDEPHYRVRGTVDGREWPVLERQIRLVEERPSRLHRGRRIRAGRARAGREAAAGEGRKRLGDIWVQVGPVSTMSRLWCKRSIA
jgi:hypothetical protein